MSTKARNMIAAIAVLGLVMTIGLAMVPRVVRALPGETYVRLQHHPLTAPVMALLTTPIPAALPQVSAGPAAVAAAEVPDIPGLLETAVPQPATPTPRATNTPAAVVLVDETAVPTPEPTQTPTPTPQPTLAPPPSRVVLDGLTTVKQGFNNCGPANLTIVLNYYGDPTTQETAAAYLKPNREDRNVSPWQISDYVNEFTALRSTVHSGGDLEMIKQFIANGLPVVIEKGYEPNNAEGWYGHYLTVYGYDEELQEVYTRDTNLGPFDGSPRVDSYDEFVYWWQQFNYTFYVVYEPAQEELVQSLIPAPLRERADMWQYTAELARQEQRDDPTNVFAWFNLGVSLTRLGELTGEASYYEQAGEAFDQARAIGLPPRTLYYEHRPLMAYFKLGRNQDVMELTDALLQTVGGPYVEEIHWYRGHALAAQGQLTAAREAYEAALEVNPNFYPAQQSRDWVVSLLNG
ncbi:MAG: C39 family peptidase [Anaerolineales bacterium]|nr:C39 family peptidase [Anaerolineales bacterium]